MTDPVEKVMHEIWDWKRKAEQDTRGMSKAELIEYYRAEADNVQKKYGLDLQSQTASQAVKKNRK